MQAHLCVDFDVVYLFHELSPSLPFPTIQGVQSPRHRLIEVYDGGCTPCEHVYCFSKRGEEIRFVDAAIPRCWAGGENV